MLKVTDNNTPLIVDFRDASNKTVSGILLTYEIVGDACILVNEERVWIPFSNLSKTSQNKVLKIETGKNEPAAVIYKDAKTGIIVTLMLLIAYSYYFLKFSY